MTLDFYLGFVWFDSQFVQYGNLQLVTWGSVTLRYYMLLHVNIWSLWSRRGPSFLATISSWSSPKCKRFIWDDRWTIVKLYPYKKDFRAPGMVPGMEPATFWWPVRRSSHWATKDRARIGVDDRSSIISRYLQAFTFLKTQTSSISLLTDSGFRLSHTYVERAP